METNTLKLKNVFGDQTELIVEVMPQQSESTVSFSFRSTQDTMKIRGQVFTVDQGVLFRHANENNRSYTFQQAVAMMKSGKSVSRGGWEGGWVCLATGFEKLEADKFWNRHTQAMAKNNPDGKATVLEYFLFVNKKNEVQMGWTPTQEDMLTDDWKLVAQ